MRKHLRRFVVLLIAMAMILAMSVSVNADGASGDVSGNTPDGTQNSTVISGDYTGKTVILSSNDVHGAIESYHYMSGLRTQYEKLGATVIAVDCGDFSSGNNYVKYSQGVDAINLMNAAGYDISTLGNHEFDYGFTKLQDNLQAAQFDIVCANVFYKDDHSAVYDPYVIKEVGDLKIGFFGLVTPQTRTKANPTGIKTIDFADDRTTPTLVGCSEDAIDRMKAEGADLIVGLWHLGVDVESKPNRSTDLYSDLLKAGKAPDIVLDGHSHTVMTKGDGGEPVMSTGTKFQNIGVTVIDNETAKIDEWMLLPVNELGEYVDAEVQEYANRIKSDVDTEYGKKIAETKVNLNGARKITGGVYGTRDGETNLGDLLADSLVWYVRNDGIDDAVPDENIVSIVNGGAFRASIPVGDITLGSIYAVEPYGNTVNAIYVTGAELLEALEAATYVTPEELGSFPQISGMNIEINTYRKYDANEQTYPESTYYGPASIRRVTIKDINGKPFDPEAQYCVVASSYLAAGGDTYSVLGNAETKIETYTHIDQVLSDYICEALSGVVDESYAEPKGRITFTSLEDALAEITGDGVTADEAGDIDLIRKKYDSMSDAEKAALPAGTSDRLEAAEAKLEALNAGADAEKAKVDAEAKVTSVTKLANNIIAASAVKTGDYKAAGVKQFKVALDAAKDILAKEGATTEEYTEATGNLKAAQDALVKKAANTLAVKAKKPSLKASKLKKKALTIAAKKALSVSKAQGKVTYKKLSGNKKITVASSGKIKVKKGLKKGSYKVRIKVSAAGTGDYKAGSKTVTLTIKVKK